MPKAYSYIRMSTPEQMKGDSTRRQLQASEDYAKEKGLEITDILHDSGLSAYTGENAEMGRLAEFLELAKSGQIEEGSYLIVESLDRISRANVMEAMALLHKIVEYGIVIVTLIDRQVYSKDIISKNPMAMMIAALVLMRAHEESHTKSVRLASAWENKRMTARNGQITRQRIPSWLRFSEDGARIEVIEERAQIVSEIFDLSGGGWGAVSIAKRLNDQGISTWAGGKHWHESYVKKILSSRAVLGEYQPHRLGKEEARQRRVPEGQPIAGYYPQIIDPVVFADVQDAIARRKVNGKGRKGRNFSNLFTGLLRCRSCKSGMRFIDKGPPPKGGQYLRCSRAMLTSDCLSPTFRYNIIQDHLFRSLTTINFDAVLNNPAWLAETTELRKLQLGQDDQEASLQSQINNVTNAIASRGYSTSLATKLDELEIGLEQLRQERREVDEQLAKMSISSGLDYHALIHRLQSPELTDEDRTALRRKFSSELVKLVSKIEIGRTYPTPGEDICDHFFQGLTLDDLDDANRFLEIVIFYRTGSFTVFDAFTDERTYYDMGDKMSIWLEKDRIKRLT